MNKYFLMENYYIYSYLPAVLGKIINISICCQLLVFLIVFWCLTDKEVSLTFLIVILILLILTSLFCILIGTSLVRKCRKFQISFFKTKNITTLSEVKLFLEETKKLISHDLIDELAGKMESEKNNVLKIQEKICLDFLNDEHRFSLFHFWDVYVNVYVKI